MNTDVSELLERSNFFARTQLAGEPYTVFALALKHFAHTCNFSTLLDSMLRDQFIRGIIKNTTRVALLRSNKKTFNEVISEAMALELLESQCDNSGSYSGGAGGGINAFHSKKIMAIDKKMVKVNLEKGQWVRIKMVAAIVVKSIKESAVSIVTRWAIWQKIAM